MAEELEFTAVLTMGKDGRASGTVRLGNAVYLAEGWHRAASGAIKAKLTPSGGNPPAERPADAG